MKRLVCLLLLILTLPLLLLIPAPALAESASAIIADHVHNEMAPMTTSYVGNSKSRKFHYTDCRAADKISSGNRVGFSSAQEARDAGYSPCGICKPR